MLCRLQLHASLANPSLRIPYSDNRMAKRSQKRCMAIGAATQRAPSKPKTAWTAQDRIEYLREDLQHLFDDKGIDPAGYDDVVDFRDPITKYSNLSGFLFNVKMLKLVFSPTFILHDIKQTAKHSITTRWTMDMQFALARRLPIVRKYWRPSIIFTGTSEYVFNPETGRIFRHLDEWDSIQNQKFFSFEGAADFLRQLMSFYSTPEGLETPKYTVLRRTRDYQVRRYSPFLVAECAMDAVDGASKGEQLGGSPRHGQYGGSAPGKANPAGPGARAFNTLAGFIFGGNDRRERMAMTTPVFTSSAGRMQFVIGPASHKDVQSVPAPNTPGIQAREEAGGLFAVRLFSGAAAEAEVDEQQRRLRASLARNGQAASGQQWLLARYNDPGTRPFLRRNEILIPLEKFELW